MGLFEGFMVIPRLNGIDEQSKSVQKERIRFINMGKCSTVTFSRCPFMLMLGMSAPTQTLTLATDTTPQG